MCTRARGGGGLRITLPLHQQPLPLTGLSEWWRLATSFVGSASTGANNLDVCTDHLAANMATCADPVLALTTGSGRAVMAAAWDRFDFDCSSGYFPYAAHSVMRGRGVARAASSQALGTLLPRRSFSGVSDDNPSDKVGGEGVESAPRLPLAGVVVVLAGAGWPPGPTGSKVCVAAEVWQFQPAPHSARGTTSLACALRM
jgi:hypothetical protein